MIPLRNQLRALFVSGVVFASIATLPQFLLFRNCADLVEIFLAHMGGQLCLAIEAGSTCCALLAEARKGGCQPAVTWEMRRPEKWLRTLTNL